jgi:hypothetical protein
MMDSDRNEAHPPTSIESRTMIENVSYRSSDPTSQLSMFPPLVLCYPQDPL